MNMPNKLTVSRVFLVPIFVWLLLESNIPSNFLWAGIIFLIAGITDHLDGILARKYFQVTDFGKFADPIADKILTLSAFLCFIELKIINCVPVIIILSREFIVTSLRLALVREEKKIICANFWGKIKTVAQISFVLLTLLLKHFGILDSFFLNLAIWHVAIITLISGMIYVVQNRKFLNFN
ncbi:MAG: CDP-diacylglycerol--glycerol-3-phosphate 3-phosphatidyltransferase [Oscillospiraceae bacterium]|jgi:CDP-diacylglycerol--glycerol-3-phosphate 3-phosphatidyltransferase|nr:CDP-diacylglycerol--glycerol-3-phosphate 3-phosphatidyltransferase [Oscillospiraceae bacterium]